MDQFKNAAMPSPSEIVIPDMAHIQLLNFSYEIRVDHEHSKLFLIISIPIMPFIKLFLPLDRIPLAKLITDLTKGQNAFIEPETKTEI